MKIEIVRQKTEVGGKVEAAVLIVVAVDLFVVISVTVHVTTMHLLRVVVMVLIVPSRMINRLLKKFEKKTNIIESNQPILLPTQLY